MQIKACKMCGKLYEGLATSKVCPRCLLTNESSFKRVREYLRENPGASMPIVAEETDVPVTVVEQFLRQERVEIAPGSPVMLACNKCGAVINTGMYCENCSKSLTSDLQKIRNTLLAESKEREEQNEGKLKYVTAKWRSK